MKTTEYIIPRMKTIELGSRAIALNQLSDPKANGNNGYDKETDDGDLVKDAGAWGDEW